MKHGFLILTHFAPERTVNQIKRLQFPDHYFFIHFDKKLFIDPTDPFYLELKNNSNVTILSKRQDVKWGSFSIVDATLQLIREALDKNDIGYLHLLSGECLPVKSMKYIQDYFRAKKGNEFIEHTIMSKNSQGVNLGRVDKFHLYDHFNLKSKKPKDVLIKLFNSGLKNLQIILKKVGVYRKYASTLPTLYHGSQWWSLSRDASRYIIDYVNDHPEFSRRMHLVLVPDEMFFQSIIMGSPFKDKVINKNLRFLRFKNTVPSPMPLTMDNIPDISNKDILFARKFTEESRELVGYLDGNVYTR